MHCIKAFFKFLMGLIGRIIYSTFMALVGVVLVVIVFAILASSNAPKAKPGSVLVLNLSVNIQDTPLEESPSTLLHSMLVDKQPHPTLALGPLIDSIDHAAKDPNIVALYLTGTLNPIGLGQGYAVLEELRNAIECFKTSGKPVYSYIAAADSYDYYLMSSADHVFMNPLGELYLSGMAVQMPFFAKALEKYGVGVQVLRAGKYKSAIEPLTLSAMSPENKEETSLYLDQTWQHVLQDIGGSRKISLQNLLSATDKHLIISAPNALDLGLVDTLKHFDEVLDTLSAVAIKDKQLGSFRQIDMVDYIASMPESQKHKARIAVIYAEGEIVDGQGGYGQVGGDVLARELRALRKDEDVKAVVLRVNSPGGDAFASEVIGREVALTNQIKPVIVSMGNYAASGGYWISVPARHIIASPTTLTGSIGVFGVTFDVQRLCADYGISWDGVKTSPFADASTISRPKTAAEIAQLQAQTEYIYQLFIDKVSSGRHLDKDKVQSIAQGHIWSGQEAMKLGLVDELGGLDIAIQKAVELADIKEPWQLYQVTSERSFIETLRCITPSRLMRVLSDDPSSISEKLTVRGSHERLNVYALWTGWWGVPSCLQTAIQ